MTGLRFGFGVPTATEGMMYPIPYADISQAVELAVHAERLGFESIWANDHITTQRYVRAEFDDPPRYFDPLAYLAFVAARTTRLRLATCVLVMPFHHPVMVARQAATLDHLSGGRLVLGLGIGAYREEVEALAPGRALHRGKYATEFMEALGRLFEERRSSFTGDYISFADIESYPKPVQDPLPILSGGNSEGARRRAATLAGGWLPACLTADEYRAGLTAISLFAEIEGRTLPESFEPALQLVVSIGDTDRAAQERFRSAQVHSHLTSLGDSTLKGKLRDDLRSRNLVGTASRIAERIEEYTDAGVRTFAGLLFAADTVEETLEQMEAFAASAIRRRE